MAVRLRERPVPLAKFWIDQHFGHGKDVPPKLMKTSKLQAVLVWLAREKKRKREEIRGRGGEGGGREEGNVVFFLLGGEGEGK